MWDLWAGNYTSLPTPAGRRASLQTLSFLDDRRLVAGYRGTVDGRRTTFHQVWDVTTQQLEFELPTDDLPPSSDPRVVVSDDGTIIVTEEGSLVWYLGLRIGWEVRVVVAAMGAGLKPELAGLILGLTASPAHALTMPTNYGKHELLKVTDRSPQGSAASGSVGRFDRGTYHIKTASHEEADQLRYPIEDLFLASKPTMLIHDDESAERAILAAASASQAGFDSRQDWGFPQIEISYEEVEALLL